MRGFFSREDFGMGPPQRRQLTRAAFPAERRSSSCVPSSKVFEHLFVGSALHSRTGKRHVEQMYDSPSEKDSAGGVNDISVSAVFNFLSVEGSDCRLDFFATDTLIR